MIIMADAGKYTLGIQILFLTKQADEGEAWAINTQPELDTIHLIITFR